MTKGNGVTLTYGMLLAAKEKLLEPPPREADVALETKEYREWKMSGKATRETCPLTIKALEQVRMIEKTAYDRAIVTLRAIANKDGKAIFNHSEEFMEGSAQAYFEVAGLAIEVLKELESEPEYKKEGL